jgi:hypothetical protein
MHNRLADPETPVDAAAGRLHAAGWSVGDAAGSAGWLVIGMNGENLIYAVAESQSAAWQLAIEQATAVGMLGT